MLWLTYQINVIGDDMNKKNLMTALTLLLIAVIGIIVPAMISNQSGAQSSRSQDGEVLLLSNQHIKFRRAHRLKYLSVAGDFTMGEDEEEVDELDLEDEEEVEEELDLLDEFEGNDSGYVTSESDQIIVKPAVTEGRGEEPVLTDKPEEPTDKPEEPTDKPEEPTDKPEEPTD